ncbi:MAG TPA: family 43 glycosylhydrolase, partial [Spirochaetia bacterium]|nr:family 43 glycosylhydrolase [Spirochaetia bacterium]
MKFVSCLLTVVLGTTAGDWAQSPQYTNPILVPDAWPDYGIGDPFVLRFDGTYYLYSSTKDGRPGVRVWTSTNLVDWAFRGLAASDPSTTGAYGPEVILYEGWFWMATSPAGTGHRFSRARSPLGPFEPFTDNLGMTIDGSFFVDEGGNLLFYHASDRGILAHRLGPEGLPGPEILLEGTRMGHWTEGPFVFRRGEHWFLGMTGNHVLSAGYRENYAVSDQGPLGPFVQPENNPLVIHTTGEFRGLGHGSVVTGPDLVSTWLVYHNLEGESAEGPPVRSYDLDRLVFNGRRLEILGPTHYGRPLPEGPDRIVQAEPTSTPGLALDAQAAPDQFTAEATVRALSDGGGLVWAAVGPGSYCRLRFEKETRRALVERVTGSETRVFETKALLPSFDFDAPHLLRLEPRGQGMVLTIDSGTPVPVPSPTAGALGWWDPVGTLAPGFTAWTAGSPDQSDLRVVHPLPGRLQGIHGTDQPRAPVSGWAGGLALGEPQPLGYDIQVPTPGTWGLRALVRGARPGPISVQVDGNPVPVTPPMASAPEGNEGWTLVD